MKMKKIKCYHDKNISKNMKKSYPRDCCRTEIIPENNNLTLSKNKK